LIAGVMLWAAGIRFRYFVAAAILGAIALFVLVKVEPYRWDRIVAFLNPDEDPLGKNYQIRQSKIAVATGGFTGQGLMDGQQKMYFLPARHTDFIFAVVCEELGFVAAFFLVAAFGVILWRGAAIARHARDDLGRYLAIGVTAMIVCQAMINLGVVLGMLPTKGLPLPFISYGNSALIVFLAASGLLLNVSQHAE
jgi:cell division protein FtsW